MRVSSSTVLGAGVACLLLAVAGCGSSSDEAAATNGGAGGATATATTTAAGGGAAGGATTSSATGGAGGATTSSATGGAGGVTPPPFALGHVFIAGSRNAEVFEYDAALKPVGHFTDPHFGTVLPFPGQSYAAGPAGMAFDASGFLVVATADSFCVFSAPGQLLECHPKHAPEPTENIIFDRDGNLYTTTSTGGSGFIHVYDESYAYVASHALPTSNLTGVTCDPQGNLYIASQLGNGSLVYKVDPKTFAVLDTIPVAGTAEGMQFASDGNLLVGQHSIGIARVKPAAPGDVVGTISNGSLLFPVPVSVDEAGRIYTADYENGSGTQAADLFIFEADGQLAAARPSSEVWGPFGMVVAGAELPCGAYHH
jgi:streptogramin lyase